MKCVRNHERALVDECRECAPSRKDDVAREMRLAPRSTRTWARRHTKEIDAVVLLFLFAVKLTILIFILAVCRGRSPSYLMPLG